jgi:hypothetical protein
MSEEIDFFDEEFHRPDGGSGNAHGLKFLNLISPAYLIQDPGGPIRKDGRGNYPALDNPDISYQEFIKRYYAGE